MLRKYAVGTLFICTTLFAIPALSVALETFPPVTESGASASATHDQTATLLAGNSLQPAADLSPDPALKDDVARTPPEATPAHPPATGDIDKIDFNYIKGYFLDTGKILASPVHWDGKDWMKAGAVVGLTAGFYFLGDAPIRDFAQGHQSTAATKVASVGNFLGENPLYAVGGLGSFYLYGYLADNHKARRTALLALESYAITGVFTEGLKTLVGRHRPNTGASPGTFDGPNWSNNNFSFCSGHTSSAFSIATIFANEYKDSAFVPPIAYGTATLIGLSRIYSNAHWSSDVLFGAALGYFTSKAILAFHKEGENRLSIMPLYGNGVAGVSVGYQF